MILNYDKDLQKWDKPFAKIVNSISKGLKKPFMKYSFGDEVLDSLFAGKSMNTKIADVLATKNAVIPPGTFDEWYSGLEEGEQKAVTLGDAFEHAGVGVFSLRNALTSLGNIGLSILSTLGTAAIAMAAAFAFGKAIEGIHNLIHAQEIAIEKGKEA